MATNDLNADGDLDYCFTDVGTPQCMLSTDGLWAEGAASLGLVAAQTEAEVLSGWALLQGDLNNDGFVDTFQSSGSPILANADGSGPAPELLVPFGDSYDLLWDGAGGRFSPLNFAGADSGSTHHYGAVEADFDGDGGLELVVGGYDQSPIRYAGGCTVGGWIEIDLEASGALAVGARVRVEAGDKWWLHEVSALSGPGQTPLRVHVGLGDVEQVDRLTVVWRDGSQSSGEDIPIRRMVKVRPPG
jgi:hypothetical protein